MDELRTEPILSMVLGDHLAESELSELQALLQDSSQTASGLELTDLMEAIGGKARMSGQHHEVHNRQ